MSEIDKLADFQREAARYFRNRPTNGEDSAHWANVYNAENCEKTADLIEAQAAEIARLREALRPFGCDDYEVPVTDENGWTEFGVSWARERIVDWFGPSDFRRARAALKEASHD